MKEKLFLKFEGDFTKFAWAFFSAGGVLKEQGHASTISEIKKNVNIEKLVVNVLIATPDVVMRQISIPETIAPQKIKKAVPSLLEEETLLSLEDLHTTHRVVAKGKLAVLSVSKTFMSQLLGNLNQEYIYPSSVRPFFLSLPITQERSVVFFDKESVSLQIDPNFGFCVDRNQFFEYLNFGSAEIFTKELFVYGKLSEEETSKLKNQPFRVKLMENKSEWYEVLEINQSYYNLLVEPFAEARVSSQSKHLIKHSIIAATLIPCMLGAYFFYQYQNLKSINDNLSNQIASIYRRIYPNAQSVTSPRQRMEQDLQKLSSNKQGEFFDLLYFLGDKARAIKNLDLLKVSYRSHELTVALEADSYQTIDTLMTQLKNTAYQVEQKNTSIQADRVKTAIVIKPHKK